MAWSFAPVRAAQSGREKQDRRLKEARTFEKQSHTPPKEETQNAAWYHWWLRSCQLATDLICCIAFAESEIHPRPTRSYPNTQSRGLLARICRTEGRFLSRIPCQHLSLPTREFGSVKGRNRFRLGKRKLVRANYGRRGSLVLAIRV